MDKTLPSLEGAVGSVPGYGAKTPYASQPKTQNINQKQYCNKFKNTFFKVVCFLIAGPYPTLLRSHGLYIARQVPLSTRLPRQEYWSGLPFSSPGVFLTQGSNSGLPHCRQMLYHLSHQGIAEDSQSTGQNAQELWNCVRGH